ncbi:hypothetical protein DFP72DRAFT_873930 [Ephemerocybe angulata]|uniref:C2H2-type domain-containing protein n=1 Tax=Ephemerocybe angulata TaxID=980116 RepID=A0A8H6IGL2_9AGAR|nr:hypothetical protein DFP72DRAFT_873930 [Tulosesus angulatus]
MPNPSPSIRKTVAEIVRSFECPVPRCGKLCETARGLARHQASKHPPLSSDDTDNEAAAGQPHKQVHSKLNGVPVNKDGIPLPEYTKAPPAEELDPNNPWYPFEDRLGFDFAHHHLFEARSSKSKINKGLDFWRAAQIQALQRVDKDASHIPWTSADHLFQTIDQIQQGNAPFTTVLFKYTGELPENPPSWMTETYELCVRDARQVIHNQLATTEFASQFNAAPYRQFLPNGERVWSNLMSGDWAWRQADEISRTVKGSNGAMLVAVVAGLDKTTVSVATGHQEYHPFYLMSGNLTNEARRGHGNSIDPAAFLPIPKVSKSEKKTKVYKTFARQLYHACIAYIFEPLRKGMSEPDLVRCPDQHFRRAIYSIGPIIADYPEQVWLTGIVQGWCPKGRSRPEDLDTPCSERRTHELSDALIEAYDPGTLWDLHGIRDDVVPFTHSFPRADIHELIAPDLLHQVIKGTFKDHLVEWVMDYLHVEHGEARATEIIADIDRRISTVPIFPGLRRFAEGRDFAQWTGDDSKALMKVYLASIVGYVPSEMVRCLAAFLEVCYIFRRNAITSSALKSAKTKLTEFHELRKIFIETGTRSHISLPRQHALSHFPISIIDFGSPNGLCSSITESCHITAVKNPWRMSNRYNALPQMLVTITRMDKLATLRRILSNAGLLHGTTSFGTALAVLGDSDSLGMHGWEGDANEGNDVEDQDEMNDLEGDGVLGAALDMEKEVGPLTGPRLASSVRLCPTQERRYPKKLPDLVRYLGEPQFEKAFLEYLFAARHPTEPPPDDVNITARIKFSGRIYIHHSATAHFYAPSDMCGTGGMQRQTIRCNPRWRGHPRRDTVFVAESDDPGMRGLLIAQLIVLFSFVDNQSDERHECALVNWFPTVDTDPDPDTGMWVVTREKEEGVCPLQVISLRTIVRGAHLLPVFGDSGRLPESFSFTQALDAFSHYFVNPYIDYHTHELLSG